MAFDFQLLPNPKGQELSDNFKSAARAGDFSKAFFHLGFLNLHDALESCLELAEQERSVFDSLAGAAEGKTQRPHFSVRIVKNGFLPREKFTDIGADNDFHVARIFILSVRVTKKALANSLWPSAETTATSKVFYPEYLVNGRRARIIALANDHVGKGPGNEQQVALFSLGGLFNYTQAESGTHPSGTTCLLFARSVLHAAGKNVIGGRTPRSTCNVPHGLGDVNQDVLQLVPAAEFDNGSRPQGGDVFWIAGGNYIGKHGEDTGTDSSHWGVIVNVRGANGEVWDTVEGGSGDHVTRTNTRTLVAAQSPLGKWRFDNDAVKETVLTNNTVSPPRAIRTPRVVKGWFNVDRMTTGWMEGA
jgi:hypothetical protein